MKIGAPAGIGDWSWIWSKLVNVSKEIDKVLIVDGWPHRTVPYVELCVPPKRRPWAEYTPIQYQTILMNEKLMGLDHDSRPTWSKVQAASHEADTLLLEANRHLELGRPLADWLPDLPPNYHYPLYTTQLDRDNAWAIIKKSLASKAVPFSSPLLGISCASYRGSEAWKTWGRKEWVDFLAAIMNETPFQPIIIGGFWDDLSHSVASTLNLPDIVGLTSVAEGIEALRIFDAYIGYSSGLNVIRTVLDLPAFALWPDFQAELSLSWCPPQMLASGRYVGVLWRSVEDVLPRALTFLELCSKEMREESHGHKV